MEQQVDIQNEIKQIIRGVIDLFIDPKIGESQKIEFKDLAFSQQINCYLTLSKMTTPTKTTSCKHFWGVEYEYFKELKVCPCKIAITNENIVVDQPFKRLLAIIENLNETYISDKINKYEDGIMIFMRSLLIFPCVNEYAIPTPLHLIKAHIESPSEVSLRYNFAFKAVDLANVKQKTIIRVCENFCLYDLDNIEIQTQFYQCKFCQHMIDIFNFQVDYYLMEVRQLLLEQSQIMPIEKDTAINMQHGKFRFQKYLYTQENITSRLKNGIKS